MNIDEPNGKRASQEEPAEDVNFLELLESSFDYSPLQRGDIREAVILQIKPNEILVDMGAKRDGVVPVNDLERLDADMRANLREGQTVPVYVLNPRDNDGNLLVSINLGLQQYDWERADKLLESQDITEVTVTGYNKGGILVNWGRLEGFVPQSHLMTMSAQMNGPNKREVFNELRGRTLGVKVIEVDQRRRRLIFSEREAQREWRAQQKARLMTELVEGDVVKGTVTGIRDFGAFVDLGGADGLIHVSELAWHRVEHPGEVVEVGQEIEVYVLELDRDRNRIALSRKRLLPDPWKNALDRYFEGQMVTGTVTNVVDFGAFIVTDDGLEGLLHLTEMGDGTLQEPYSYVKKGDCLQLRIARLEPEKRRVGFTQRGSDIQKGVIEPDVEPVEPVELDVEPVEPDVEPVEPVELDVEPVEPVEPVAEDEILDAVEEVEIAIEEKTAPVDLENDETGV
ncbi:MAG: S1 RNA-binding domain-containing protein [Anaerolineae bacterium]|nr:S1 RNA-binding domain-containing protein [Anaerolineae bacterium]